jgi:CheY-like chemotaxis protein
MENLVEGPKKPIVLIVDDETTARFVTREVLSGAGFETEEAEDGVAALQMLEDLKPDIVIADVMMPVMDGFTLCEEIRRRPGAYSHGNGSRRCSIHSSRLRSWRD